MNPNAVNRASISKAIGVGLRSPHAFEMDSTRPAIGWLEIHTENYLGGGPPLARLTSLRKDYPLSLHGVGLSLGTATGLDREHLSRTKQLIGRMEPFLVSEHLSWSIANGMYLNDLLPLPYTEESLAIVVTNVEMAQEALGRQILIENPSRYLDFRHSVIDETAFLSEIVRRTGCGILLDVNNVFVTCSNLGGEPRDYLDALDGCPVGEIHLAGHARVMRGGVEVLIDDHASVVSDPVWELFEYAIGLFGVTPSLIEWDKNLPPLETLLGQARKAERIATARIAGHVAAA
jgi:uncharacterized protein (UPF0276 family)